MCLDAGLLSFGDGAGWLIRSVQPTRQRDDHAREYSDAAARRRVTAVQIFALELADKLMTVVI